MQIVKIVRGIKTYIRYPIVSGSLLFSGCRKFIIGKGLQINRLGYLHLGRDVSIGRDARLLFVPEYAGVKHSPSIKIGNNVSIGNRFSALSAAEIVIEDNNLIASDVLITSENHGMELEKAKSYAELPLKASPVTIGEGCWIGEKVSIMPGVTIGSRCIIAANSVVTHSFPSGKLIAGTPARAIKTYDYDKHMWIKETED